MNFKNYVCMIIYKINIKYLFLVALFIINIWSKYSLKLVVGLEEQDTGLILRKISVV